ncbi:MAG TPA: Gfo/Idh/MocA family oxidoreductase, partial [Clostridia bacterium]|nr:Gfo/Idh/MocA family oxidoreductase [Clostridia bacterium]
MKTISCIGLGDRGTEYLRFIKHFNSKKIKVTALCDIKKSALDEIAPIYKIPENMRFLSADEFFKNGALSDAVIISTQDKTHFDITKRAIEAGYKYILLEKPVSDKIEECIILRDMAKERGVTIVVCHVLRYSDYYRTIKDAIRSGAIGELISINHVENIGYFHFSHSYVRGSWRREELSSPSILAKCCHDLDLLGWFVDKKPVAVSSTGGLHYFKRENAPEGAAERCLAGCKAKENCVYDCEALYITDPIWRATFLRLKGRTITGVKGATK